MSHEGCETQVNIFFSQCKLLRTSVRHMTDSIAVITRFGHHVKLALKPSTLPGCLGNTRMYPIDYDLAATS